MPGRWSGWCLSVQKSMLTLCLCRLNDEMVHPGQSGSLWGASVSQCAAAYEMTEVV